MYCIRCKERRATRPRGLCVRCYYSSDRFMFPLLKVATTDAAKNMANNNVCNRPLPPEPTDALPGSREKIDVMTERDSAGYTLWHPLDARYITKEENHDPEGVPDDD